MTKNMKLSLTQVVTVLVVWGTYIYMGDPETMIRTMFGVQFFPYLALVCGLIASFYHTLFAMGVGDWNDSTLFAKVLPIVYLGILIYTVSLITQTYVTASVVSLFMGVATAYIAKIILQK